MPLYVADYRADTAHLNASQHGAYLLLIMHYWSTGGLPVEDAPLARIACMTEQEWRRSRTTIAAFFTTDWHHKRIDIELARAADISSKRRASAVQMHAKRDANAQHLDTHARATSQPQSQEDSSLRSEARKRAKRLGDDWWPSLEDATYAQSKGLSDAEISTEAEKFRNHWTSKSGKDAAKLRWDLTWQNWILTAIERGKGRGNGHDRQRGESLGDLGRRLANEARELERAAGIGRSDEPLGGH